MGSGEGVLCIFDSASQLSKIKSLLPGSLKIIAIPPCFLKIKENIKYQYKNT